MSLKLTLPVQFTRVLKILSQGTVVKHVFVCGEIYRSDNFTTDLNAIYYQNFEDNHIVEYSGGKMRKWSVLHVSSARKPADVDGCVSSPCFHIIFMTRSTLIRIGGE